MLFLGAMLSAEFNGFLKGICVGVAFRIYRSKVIKKLFSKKVPTVTFALEPSLFKYSVVVPSNNGYSRGISDLIYSLLNQTVKPEKIIVVDSGSSDDSLNWYNNQPCVEVVRIHPSEFNHAASRNLGISKVSSEFTLLTVDDAIFIDENWVEKAASLLIQNDAVSISGRQKPKLDCDAYGLSKNLSLIEHQGALGQSYLSRQGRFVAKLRGVSPFWSQLPSIGIDDTNHLARTSTLRDYPFQATTCEDLFYSLALVKQNKRVLFSNQLEVSHSHFYPLSTLPNYAKRVYLDNLELSKISFFPLKNISASVALASGISAIEKISVQKSMNREITDVELYISSFLAKDIVDRNLKSQNLVMWMENQVMTQFSRVCAHDSRYMHRPSALEDFALFMITHITSTILANDEKVGNLSKEFLFRDWNMSAWR